MTDFRHPDPVSSLYFMLFETAELEPAGIASVLLAELPDCTVNVQQGEAGLDGELVVAEFDEATVYAVPVNSTVPAEELAAAAANNLIWAEAGATAAKHKSHVVVMSVPRAPETDTAEDGAGKGGGGGCGCGGCSCGAGGNSDARWNQLAAQLRQLEVLAALSGMDGCLAVYFGALNVVYAPDFCREIMQLAMEDEGLPLPLLTYLACAPDQDGNVAFTYGLRPLGHEEIEFRSKTIDVEELYGLLFNVCHYILSSGSSLYPGETLGYTEEKDFIVSLQEGTVVDGDVLLVMEAPHVAN